MASQTDARQGRRVVRAFFLAPCAASRSKGECSDVLLLCARVSLICPFGAPCWRDLLVESEWDTLTEEDEIGPLLGQQMGGCRMLQSLRLRSCAHAAYSQHLAAGRS